MNKKQLSCCVYHLDNYVPIHLRSAIYVYLNSTHYIIFMLHANLKKELRMDQYSTLKKCYLIFSFSCYFIYCERSIYFSNLIKFDYLRSCCCKIKPENRLISLFSYFLKFKQIFVKFNVWHGNYI